MAVTSSDRRKRPTIRDIAREAGVSRGTVSRVLNGGRSVSPDALAAVTRVIEDTGYSANRHARSLAQGRSNTVAFLLTEPQHLLFEDPNFSTLLRGAAEALSERDIPLVLMLASTPDERRRTIEFLTAGHVDGVLVVSSHAGDPVVEALLKADIPVVTSGRPLAQRRPVGHVAADDVAGAREMTGELVRQGRRRIAMITGPLDTSGGVDRLTGYQQALGEAFDPDLVVHGSYTRDSGEESMARLLQVAPDVDAVFVGSDLMAVGALSALRVAGRRVPGDVAVAGFDDSVLARTSEPPLSTVHQPFDRISREMVRVLLEVVEGQDPVSVTIPTRIVLRAST